MTAVSYVTTCDHFRPKKFTENNPISSKEPQKSNLSKLISSCSKNGPFQMDYLERSELNIPS